MPGIRRRFLAMGPVRAADDPPSGGRGGARSRAAHRAPDTPADSHARVATRMTAGIGQRQRAGIGQRSQAGIDQHRHLPRVAPTPAPRRLTAPRPLWGRAA